MITIPMDITNKIEDLIREYSGCLKNKTIDLHSWDALGEFHITIKGEFTDEHKQRNRESRNGVQDVLR